MKWMAAFAVLLATVACGGPSNCAGGSCSCPDVQACVCPTGMTCNWSGGTCKSGNCQFACSGAGSTCNGTCPGDVCIASCMQGASCNVSSGGNMDVFDCDGSGSTCSFSVGANGQVNCTNGGACHITCSGACQVYCSSGSTCDLKCKSDSAPKTVSSSANCT